MVSADVNVIMR